ncbi:MAG TPA: ATP-dependent Clp protease ATP-binding subunit [Candidatus Coprosoma intestinipullorum]|uniref:ATP-dependent Clp protease ATP-binding subunit n=1 Tax=Candidatus Coprosoma intestinipullorum TaxID=2840752 RepID=A0A9D0ZSD1_9FIRM|nr:ATP-dependent Clp protease ATP-binding subunit [Candidatus Coprosoma intestinipullorum]
MNNENNVVFDQNNSFEIESNNPNVTITRRTITPNQGVSQDNRVLENEESQGVIVESLDPNKFPIITNYCEDLTAKEYVTNPAIAREDEIKKTMLVLLTPDKSALLIGKAGIGKTAIVEGIAYKIQRGDVPNALKGYHIEKINSSSMLGSMTVNGKKESVTNLLVAELKRAPKTILFIDEVHTLIGGSKDGPMDLANILKPALDRGDIKAIGATTTIEYETYIVRDRAFLRRFDRIEVLEPSRDATIQILMGTIPKIEHSTGIKMIKNHYIATLLVESIVDATSEYKRVYGLSAMYPDVSLSVLSGAFSNALFENRQEVDIIDVYTAIRDSKRIYPDSRVKECAAFRDKFKRICEDRGIVLPDVKIEDVDTDEDL